MSDILKFEFDFEEVFEGVKQGVIRELAEVNFDNASNQVKNELKSEIKNKIYLTYRDENEIKNEIKEEIKDKVFKTLINDVSGKYLNQFNSYIETQLTKNPERLDKLELDIRNKVSRDLYDRLYESIQYEMDNKIKIIIAQFVSNLGGNNLKIDNTNNMITKEEYDELLKRSNELEALEQGGVDDWEWYGESLRNYFGKNNE